jgi:exopolysaccharide biosynthesis predicted pyruvyltransferase EpsI
MPKEEHTPVAPLDAFESFLVENRDDKICAITPGGNHGDTLIHMGLVKKLDELGIEYVCRNLEENYASRRADGLKYLLNIAASKVGMKGGFRLMDIPEDTGLILFEGGGYMNDLWYGLVLLREILRHHDQPIAVAPQSYWFKDTDLMGMLAGERPVTMFCRELYSRELLASKPTPPNVRILISGDTALYLGRSDLDSLIDQWNDIYDLICFRRDRESKISRKLRGEVIAVSESPLEGDISKVGSLRDFVSTVANAMRVHTDRLHVAILSHILGREATLYDSFYHKSRGVYEYSLRQNPMISFIEFTR